MADVYVCDMPKLHSTSPELTPRTRAESLGGPFFRRSTVILCRLIPQTWLFAALRLFSLLLPISIYGSIISMINQPYKTERVWMKSVKNVPAKGTWFAPDADKITDINAWSMESNKMDLIILWIHGGGFCFGADTMYSPALIQLVKELTEGQELKVRLFSLHYGLAPEHKWPSARSEALQCYRNLLQKLRIPACKIIIAGDSCGAGLAVSLISEIMNEFLPLPRAAILVSPWLSMELTSPTYQTNAQYDYLTLQSTRAYRDLYLPPNISYTDPGISPIHLPSFQYFPPMLVIYGAKEVFQHEIEVLIKKCKDNGVDIQSMAAPNAAHVWIMLEHLCRNDAAWTNAIKNTAEWCARQISSDL